jgi:hypothetical protein
MFFRNLFAKGGRRHSLNQVTIDRSELDGNAENANRSTRQLST